MIPFGRNVADNRAAFFNQGFVHNAYRIDKRIGVNKRISKPEQRHRFSR